jgi:hypothetical protein
MIGAPVAIGLAAVLAWVWIADVFTIRGLRRELAAEQKTVGVLTDSINNPATGWRVRLQTSQNNMIALQMALDTQNTRVLVLEAEGKARTEAAARQLAAARAERDRLNQRITAILNLQQPDDPADIIREAEAIVLGSIQ